MPVKMTAAERQQAGIDRAAKLLSLAPSAPANVAVSGNGVFLTELARHEVQPGLRAPLGSRGKLKGEST